VSESWAALALSNPVRRMEAMTKEMIFVQIATWSRLFGLICFACGVGRFYSSQP